MIPLHSRRRSAARLRRQQIAAGLLPILAAFAGGCAPAAPTPPPTLAATPSVTALAPADDLPSPAAGSPTPRTIAAPPPAFSSQDLRDGVEPAGYLADACETMRKRWDPEGSAPGTVVLPIMFHSIREPSNMVADNVTVSTDYFHATVDLARRLGFETITTNELAAFLTDNAPIPPRSMLIIVDDRRPGVVSQYLLPVAEAFDWTVTLGWIIGDTRPSLWSTMEGLAETGRLDVQSHGYGHRYIVEDMPEAEVRQEIAGSIPILLEHFGYRPTAFVWPGGNFTRRSVEIAREEGYRLGFTAFSRGPLLFDWIPLGEEERAVGDPRMVLPRAWSTAAMVNLQEAADIGDQAVRFAAENRQAEADWFAQTCGGPLPGSE